jgi:hypothetical protein
MIVTDPAFVSFWPFEFWPVCNTLHTHTQCADSTPPLCCPPPLVPPPHTHRPWLEQLGSNLKREHNLRIMLNSYVWGRIFTHVQKAKAAVYR